MDEKCENCKFWGRVFDTGRLPAGLCRRHAPAKYTVLKIIQHDDLTIEEKVESPFPGVSWSDWCGEYQPAKPKE